MLVELSKAQDIEAGDGTTSVVVLAGALLDACTKLLGKGIHSTTIADAFLRCAAKAEEILRGMAIPVALDDRDSLIRAATTSLSSKVVSNNSQILAPIAVDSVLRVSDMAKQQVDLRDIHIVKQLGGTIDDSELVEGLVFTKPSDTSVLGVNRVVNAKIGIAQFHLSAPKTDIDNKVIINDYTQMDRLLREERKYILEMCKKIKKSGCNVLLVQKSILRDAVNELSLHFLSKLKIMVISDIEREDIEFIARVSFLSPSHADAGLQAGGARGLLHGGQAGSGRAGRGGGAGGAQDRQDHRRRQPRQDRLRAAARLQQAGEIVHTLSRRCSTSPSARCTTRSASFAAS
mgnify:FL=1